MGGEIKWSALELVIDILGVTDVEPFVASLVAMRDFQNKKAMEDRG